MKRNLQILKRSLGAAVAVGVLSMQHAYAALDPAVTGAMGDAKSDVVELGGLALILIVAAAAFKYMRRAL